MTSSDVRLYLWKDYFIQVFLERIEVQNTYFDSEGQLQKTIIFTISPNTISEFVTSLLKAEEHFTKGASYQSNPIDCQLNAVLSVVVNEAAINENEKEGRQTSVYFQIRNYDFNLVQMFVLSKKIFEGLLISFSSKYTRSIANLLEILKKNEEESESILKQIFNFKVPQQLAHASEEEFMFIRAHLPAIESLHTLQAFLQKASK